MLSPVRADFVDGAGALQHNAVHGDILTGADDEDVAFLHLLNGDVHFRTVPQQRGSLGGQLHQALEGIRGFALGTGLQHLAHGDEGQDHGGGFKIELHACSA